MQILLLVYVPNEYFSIYFTDISLHNIFLSDLVREESIVIKNENFFSK